MPAAAVMPLGVIVERREIDNPWQDHAWAPVDVIPGAPQPEGWQVIDRGEGWVRYHAATLPLELFRGETEAYRVNLSDAMPSVYVHLRSTMHDDEPEHEIAPSLVTVSPFEAQDYLNIGEDIVERVAMPDGLIAWVQAFVDEHHVEEPFEKRRREDHKGVARTRELFVRDPAEIPVNRRPRGGRDG